MGKYVPKREVVNLVGLTGMEVVTRWLDALKHDLVVQLYLGRTSKENTVELSATLTNHQTTTCVTYPQAPVYERFQTTSTCLRHMWPHNHQSTTDATYPQPLVYEWCHPTATSRLEMPPHNYRVTFFVFSGGFMTQSSIFTAKLPNITLFGTSALRRQIYIYV